MKSKKIMLILSSLIIVLFSTSLITYIIKYSKSKQNTSIKEDDGSKKAKDLLINYYNVKEDNLTYLGISDDYYIFQENSSNTKYKVSLTNDMIIPEYNTTSSSSAGTDKRE